MTNGEYIDFHKQVEALVQQWIDHAVDFNLRVDVVDQIRLEEKIREMFLQLKEENVKLSEALRYIAFSTPDQCEDIRFGIENNCLAEVYKAEAQRTLWGEE
jgi:hypothetical protein